MCRSHLLAALSCAALLAPAQDRPVSGEYLEDRSSRVFACPCEWSDELVQKGREVVLAWKIHTGEFRGKSLAGLKAAAVLTGDYNLSLPQTPRRSTLFLDAGAPALQRSAGEAWLRARFCDLIGQVLAVHAVPIEMRNAPDAVTLRIRDTLLLQMRRADPTTDSESWGALIYEPLIELSQSTLGATLRTQYSSPDLRRGWKREERSITGYYGRFISR